MKNHLFKENVENAVKALQHGKGIVIADRIDRENEGDLVFACQNLTQEQVAQMIRDCSGIICVVISEKKAQSLNLPFMVSHNKSKNHTNFTVSIEASSNVTTGVSAQDRLTTIKAISNINAKKGDIVSPGHVFPLIAKNGGVLERDGHTEATMDITKLAGLDGGGVLCELTNTDGSMMQGDELVQYAKKYDMPLLTIDDIKEYIKFMQKI